MSIAFQSKDEQVLSRQLAVQELTVSNQCPGLYSSVSGSILIDVKETVGEIVSAIFTDSSSASILLKSATIATSIITVASIASIDAKDSLTVKYVIAE